LAAPAVLYDDGDFDAVVDADERRTINAVQWIGLCGLSLKCLSTCGCCCGCCGMVTPIEAAQCMAASKK
jgi:hypothetical protein